MIVWLMAVLLGASLANADAIDSNRDEPDCPDGSSLDMHSGTCGVLQCYGDSCQRERHRCQSVKLCVRDARSGRSNDPYLQAERECESQRDCGAGFQCRPLRACVDESGLCAAGGRSSLRSAIPFLVLALGLGVVGYLGKKRVGSRR